MNRTTFLGEKPINRVGYGAMQLAGRGVFRTPMPSRRHRGPAQAVELRADYIDTAQFYGPDVVNQLILQALQ
jgi:pyridoxine 4-dehydrogenase